MKTAIGRKRFHDACDLEANRVTISKGKTNKMVDDEEPEALLRTALELNQVRYKNSEIKTNQLSSSRAWFRGTQ